MACPRCFSPLGKNSTTVFNIGGPFDNNDGTLETASQNVGLDTGSIQNVGGKLLHTGLGLFGISQASYKKRFLLGLEFDEG